MTANESLTNVAPRAYMMGLDLQHRRVVVIGGGKAATEKVRTLLGHGAELVVVAPQLSDELLAHAKTGVIAWRQREFKWRDPFHSRLTIVAREDESEDLRISHWARLFGSLVNVVDRPELCEAIVPAVIRCGPATIGISTSGTTPAGARFLREEIQAALPHNMAEILQAAGSARTNLRRDGSYRYDYDYWRREFFERAIESNSGESITQLRDRFEQEFVGKPVRH